MELCKIVVLESALLQQRDSQGVAHGEVAVVLAVGLSPADRPPHPTETSSVTSLFFANVEVILPVMPTVGIQLSFHEGSSWSTSCVSPLF
ncbi:MAG: hypothetical protein MRJ92_09775 [Nitrospira sp.]|nr:hypothetical protein [Nitrospira sp.]